jgi:hypothetical protein
VASVCASNVTMRWEFNQVAASGRKGVYSDQLGDQVALSWSLQDRRERKNANSTEETENRMGDTMHRTASFE